MRRKIILPLWLVLTVMFISISANSISTANASVKGAVGMTDDLGREAKIYEQTRKGKYVGMFYHLLSGGSGTPDNATEIFKNNPDALTNSDVWSKEQSGYYWGQSVFGYYDMKYDEYVLRRHAQLLYSAGVDTIIIDYSNACVNGVENTLTDYYKTIIDKLVSTYLKMRAEGSGTPQITFLLTWSENGAAAAFKHLFDDYYSKPEYKELWFKWKEGILVIGSPADVPEELQKGFTFRSSWPYYAAPDVENAWPWLSVYPQEPAYTSDNDCEAVAVSVAQNWHDGLSKKEYCFFSDRDTDGNFIAQGRSYTKGSGKLLKDPISASYESEKGANYAQQWERALELDPDFVFITGWNEACVARFVGEDFPVIGKFCDQFTTEFSRDIEPSMEGELSDNFYCQTCEYIRLYKNGGGSVYNKSCETDSDGFPDWDSVALTYSDEQCDEAVRHCKGYGVLYYENITGRNDIISSKVAYNNENIYFYTETKNALTPFYEKNWMNLFIGLTDENGSIRKDINNWQGFSFVVNRENVGDGVTRLERSRGGWDWEIADDFIEYSVSGNKLQVRVPLTSIGLKSGEAPRIVFKWTDGIDCDGEILKFYTDGDTAPNARAYFVFTAPDGIEKGDIDEKINEKSDYGTAAIITASAVGVASAGIAVGLTIRKKKIK